MALFNTAILRDTYANRPTDNTALTEGRLFYATDRGIIYRDNGSSWDVYSSDISSLTADASPDGAADYVMTHDASAGYPKKVLLDDLPGGGGGGAASVIYTSAYASPPASPNDGDWWLPSDSPGIAYARVSGVWIPRGPIFPLKGVSGFPSTWVNQGGATVDTSKGGAYLLAPAAAGNNLRLLLKTAPATPYTVTVCLMPQLYRADFAFFGLCFRQSSDGKLHTLQCGHNSGFVLESNKWSAPTTPVANYVSVAFNYPALVWMRIADNGTNRITSWSSDGQHFHQLHSVGRTDYLTPDQVGIFVMSNNASYPAGVTVLSWDES